MCARRSCQWMRRCATRGHSRQRGRVRPCQGAVAPWACGAEAAAGGGACADEHCNAAASSRMHLQPLHMHAQLGDSEPGRGDPMGPERRDCGEDGAFADERSNTAGPSSIHLQLLHARHGLQLRPLHAHMSAACITHSKRREQWHK